MSFYAVERNFHPPITDKGFRYAADFEIKFFGDAYATIVITVLWNQKVALIKGTTSTTTTITEAGLSMSRAGIGWAVLADIPGEDPWIQHSDRVIRFRKRFSIELPIAPVVAGIPVAGDIAKEVNATTITRIEAEGFLDVLSYKNGMATHVY